VAGLIRVTGDWDLAEDCVQDAVERALARWPRDGVPDNPAAWLTTTAHRRALDVLRRRRTEAGKLRELTALATFDERSAGTGPGPDPHGEVYRDDRLRLLFTCCHPALPLAGDDLHSGDADRLPVAVRLSVRRRDQLRSRGRRRFVRGLRRPRNPHDDRRQRLRGNRGRRQRGHDRRHRRPVPHDGVARIIGFRANTGPAEWLAAIGVIALAIFALTWLAVALGLAAKSPEGANGSTLFLQFGPFISSAFVDPDTMPAGGVRWFAENQPFTPMIETLRGLLLGTPSGNSAVIAVAWCAAIALVGYLWARAAYNRDPSR